jgi:hypothetical protein
LLIRRRISHQNGPISGGAVNKSVDFDASRCFAAICGESEVVNNSSFIAVNPLESGECAQTSFTKLERNQHVKERNGRLYSIVQNLSWLSIGSQWNADDTDATDGGGWNESREQELSGG